MLLLVDTREQLPLEFKFPTKVGKLSVGDYGCQYDDGHICPTLIERKSLNDLFGSLGKNYKRFGREIVRAHKNNQNIIIAIEGSISNILVGTRFSFISGIKIMRTLLTLWVRYGVISVFCKDREEMSVFVAEFYCAYNRNRIKEAKKVKC